MSIKLIASDIDGTLIPYQCRASERTRAAIRKCADHGVVFTVATGRWYVWAKKAALELGQESGYMITASGSAILTFDGEPLQEWGIPEPRARKAYEILRKRDMMINAFTRFTFYRINTRACFWRKLEADGYQQGEYRFCIDHTNLFERDALKNPYKMEAYCAYPEVLAAAREELTEAGFLVASANNTNIEITEPGMGKGNAVKWLADHLGIQKDECMAMGDYTNDISLLNAVGMPVAMGNADEALKRVARLIAPDSKDDGAAVMIERALEDRL